jgi:hypothetical protein
MVWRFLPSCEIKCRRYIVKKIVLLLPLFVAATVFSNLSTATASSSGYFYTTIQYISGEPYFSQIGAFNTLEECNLARNADYGDGGAVPFDGGPGCFYLHDNEINAYNELIDDWNGQINDPGGLPALEQDIHVLLEDVNQLIARHNIKSYRESMANLVARNKR